MLSSTSWSAKKHTFTCLLRGTPSDILRKETYMALGTTRPESLPLATLSENYRTWCTSRHSVLEIMAVVDSELLADWHSPSNEIQKFS